MSYQISHRLTDFNNYCFYTCMEQNCKISSFVLYRIITSKQHSPIAIGVANSLRISINYLQKC